MGLPLRVQRLWTVPCTTGGADWDLGSQAGMNCAPSVCWEWAGTGGSTRSVSTPDPLHIAVRIDRCTGPPEPRSGPLMTPPSRRQCRSSHRPTAIAAGLVQPRKGPPANVAFLPISTPAVLGAEGWLSPISAGVPLARGSWDLSDWAWVGAQTTRVRAE